jgi:hypothetical protein
MLKVSKSILKNSSSNSSFNLTNIKKALYSNLHSASASSQQTHSHPHTHNDFPEIDGSFMKVLDGEVDKNSSQYKENLE